MGVWEQHSQGSRNKGGGGRATGAWGRVEGGVGRGGGVVSAGLPPRRARALGSGLQPVPLWAVEVWGDLWDCAELTRCLEKLSSIVEVSVSRFVENTGTHSRVRPSGVGKEAVYLGVYR